MDIIYEDNHLWVVNKPAGLLTQPSGTDQDSLEAQGKRFLKEKYQKPGNVFLEAAHRLDKGASGLTVFARTSKALARLQTAWRAKETYKVYFALTEAPPQPAEGTLCHYLFHGDFRALVVSSSYPEAKLCRLHYKTIALSSRATLLEIELETGRYHQIRAQLAFIGCPLIGDKKYGARIPYAPDKICLHHGRLEILHPVKREPLFLQCPYPAEWQAFL